MECTLGKVFGKGQPQMTWRVLDLFCGAGGSAMGLHRAWPDAEIVGVDIVPQKHYPFTCVQGDAMTFPLDGFDFIWASPPCQAFCKYKNMRPNLSSKYPNLIAPIRERLNRTGRPYIIENVPRAPLGDYTFVLCGSSFYLPIRRHRWFESNCFVLAPPCNHDWQRPQYPSSTDRKPMSRRTIEVGSWDIPLSTQRAGMDIDWMDLEELSEAIPPAYSEYIARQIRQP